MLKKWLLILELWTIFLQIVYIFLPTKNIIMSSKLVQEKYLQHMDTKMMCYVWYTQMVEK